MFKVKIGVWASTFGIIFKVRVSVRVIWSRAVKSGVILPIMGLVPEWLAIAFLK